MTPMQAIQSATIQSARLLRREGELGSIAPGKFADLIAVEGDPLANIDVLTDVRSVIKNGESICDGAAECGAPDEGKK
jgi:imidazolonepropionase-like amidohydrolase